MCVLFLCFLVCFCGQGVRVTLCVCGICKVFEGVNSDRVWCGCGSERCV